jgi:endonuclease/exonuclease/phosphatase family metal-dependent hydrolase
MKIYSWNVRYDNRKMQEVEKYIESLDADIIALQEVPEKLLEWLKTLPYFCVSSTDWVNRYGKFYLVILSKFPILTEKSLELSQDIYHNRDSRLSLIFKKIMKWGGSFSNRTILGAEIELPDGTKCVVFSVHLFLLSGSEVRYKEFELLEKELESEGLYIICGDFNILSSPHITLINVLLGGTIDQLLWWKEKRFFNKIFSRLGLCNPLAGKITHPISLSQLDYIILSSSFSLKRSKVLLQPHGSDHFPIMVEVKDSST